MDLPLLEALESSWKLLAGVDLAGLGFESGAVFEFGVEFESGAAVDSVLESDAADVAEFEPAALPFEFDFETEASAGDSDRTPETALVRTAELASGDTLGFELALELGPGPEPEAEPEVEGECRSGLVGAGAAGFAVTEEDLSVEA